MFTLRGVTAAEKIRGSIAHLMQMDFEYGGGHTRQMLLQFFRKQVVPLLTKYHPAPARREIFSAAAEVAQLLGWSAYDAGRHVFAKRYFIQGLRLAREANDHLLGGRMLASMSHQANYLGRFSDAVMYARAAQSATQGRATNTVSSLFLSMEARGLANLGDSAGTATALHHAEKLFETRVAGSEPEWIGYFDALELAGEASHCFRDLGDARQTKLFIAQAIDPVLTPARTRAFIQMVSAAASLSAGETEEAVHLATEAIDLADGLQSSRYLRYVTDFHTSLVTACGQDKLVSEFAGAIGQRYPALILPGGDGR